eukprot:225992-Chlamydomonas_euryale.AAC.1
MRTHALVWTGGRRLLAPTDTIAGRPGARSLFQKGEEAVSQGIDCSAMRPSYSPSCIKCAA